MMEKPKISVHMLVRDGAAVVGRALRPLRGLPAEVCFVDTGSTDGTPEVLAKVCAEVGLPCSGLAVSPTSRPDLFFPDVPESYEWWFEYSSDCCRTADRCMTGIYLLRDWSAARNLGLDMCRGQWILKLDADDEPMVPENICKTIDRLESRPEIEVVACPYEIMKGPAVEYTTMYTRLWRNLLHIRFREVCHENVDWVRDPAGSNWIMTNSGMLFRDWRDAGGASRVPHRNFKVLLREYLRGDEKSNHLLIYLAEEAVGLWPEWALKFAREVRGEVHPTDRAWLESVRGRALEGAGRLLDAEFPYAWAADLGSGRSELHLAMLHARLGRDGWREELARAVAHNEYKYYPRYASKLEVDAAKDQLSGR